MSKIKLNTGLASIIVVASLFGGWSSLLLITLLMLVFCEIEDGVKNVMVRVITFFVGYTLVSLGWSVIVDVVQTVTSSLSSIVTTINLYLDPIDYLDLTKLTTPINTIISIADDVVNILLTLAKIGFVVAVLTGSASKENAVTRKINEYVSKAINYVNGVVSGSTQATPNQTQTPQNPQNTNM